MWKPDCGIATLDTGYFVSRYDAALSRGELGMLTVGVGLQGGKVSRHTPLPSVFEYLPRERGVQVVRLNALGHEHSTVTFVTPTTV